jgi:hypothetical protein
MYSTVKRATMLVSTPNHERKEMRWNVGTVSKTVTNAENTIKNVVRVCKRKADGDDFGCSRSAKRFRRHGGFISASALSSFDCG